MTRLMNLLKNVNSYKECYVNKSNSIKRLMDNFTDYWTVCIRRMNFFKLSVIK